VLLKRLREAFADERYEILYAHVREQVNRALGLERIGQVDWTQPLTQFGLDSLMAVELRNALGNDLGLRLPATLFLDNPTVEAVAGKLLHELNEKQLVTPQSAPSVATAQQAVSLADIDDLSEEKLAALLMNELESSGNGDRHE
jgi:acyl carrier protein